MSKKVTVYSTTTCPYCVMLTRWLNENEVPYTEYKVDQNPVAAQSMIQLSSQTGVPFTTVEDDKGQVAKVLGFDVPRIEQALGV